MRDGVMSHHVPTACTKEASTCMPHVSRVHRHLEARVTTSTAPDSRRHCPNRGTKGADMDRTTRSVGSILLRLREAEKRERQKRTAAIAAGSGPPVSEPPVPASLPWEGREMGEDS